MKIENLLLGEVQSEVESLGKMELGTETYDKTVTGITKIVDRINEIKKIDMERDKIELEYKKFEEEVQRRIDEKNDRIIKNCLTGISIGGGFAISIWGAKRSWQYNDMGTVTDPPGRFFERNLFSMWK